MLRTYVPSTVLAILIGSALAVAAFLPVVAVRYRRAGRLRLADVLTLLMVAIYAIALWSYTLIPLPEPGYQCVRSNLHPLAFIDDILAEGRPLLRNRALFQAVMNVALFVPLGFFLRVLARRGIVVATGIGLVITLAIESTQFTGVWGLFPCAYRVFDVDDLILNTAGATLGSLLAIPPAAILRRTRPAPAADHVTLGRRYVGMLADLLVIGFLAILPAVAWRAIALYLLDIPYDRLPATVDSAISFLVPLVVQGYWVLGRGRTVGEDIVQLEPVASPGTLWWSRPLKLLFGVGGYLVLGLPPLTAVLPVFILVTVLVAWRSRDHRGLSHLVARMELRVETRPPAVDRPASGRW